MSASTPAAVLLDWGRLTGSAPTMGWVGLLWVGLDLIEWTDMVSGPVDTWV